MEFARNRSSSIVRSLEVARWYRKFSACLHIYEPVKESNGEIPTSTQVRNKPLLEEKPEGSELTGLEYIVFQFSWWCIYGQKKRFS